MWTNSFICSNFQYDRYLADLDGEVSFALPKVEVQVKYFSPYSDAIHVCRLNKMKPIQLSWRLLKNLLVFPLSQD